VYYQDKIESLKDLFGTNDVLLEKDSLAVGGRRFPVVDDVIVLREREKWPSSLRSLLSSNPLEDPSRPEGFAEDIQYTFGEEWKKFSGILPEHRDEFCAYFDLIDLDALKDGRICDLGCGTGRWSYFLRDRCRELILVDFSEAIFIARQNLRDTDNAIFIMADIRSLPFRESFADFLFCLGVLHHLPVDALQEVRRLKKFAPQLLIYLYYALDNRPFHFRILLGAVTGVRRTVSKIRNACVRSAFTSLTAAVVYVPLIKLGGLLCRWKLSHLVPLYEGYKGKSLLRIKQDVYDRFFTRIEQRFTRRQIEGLRDVFAQVRVSDSWPYWHFLCS